MRFCPFKSITTKYKVLVCNLFIHIVQCPWSFNFNHFLVNFFYQTINDPFKFRKIIPLCKSWLQSIISISDQSWISEDSTMYSIKSSRLNEWRELTTPSFYKYLCTVSPIYSATSLPHHPWHSPQSSSVTAPFIILGGFFLHVIHSSHFPCIL